MPLFDFVCDQCGGILEDQYRNIAEGASQRPPMCPECPGVVYMRWLVTPVAVDASGGAAFKPFDIDVDHHRVTIDSVHTARRIEQISEQRYRNGEGEPIRFRMLNNDASNKDVNAFGHRGTIGGQTYADGEAPAPKARKKIGVKRHGTEAPEVTVGPGMKGHAASALKGFK